GEPRLFGACRRARPRDTGAMARARFRRAPLLRRSGIEAAGRRGGTKRARANLGAAHLRREWHHRRLYRRGLKDGDPGESLRQTFLSSRRPAGSGGGARRIPRLRARAAARRLQGGVSFARREPRAATAAVLALSREGA